MNNLVIFKPSKKELQLLFNENVETKKDIFLEIMKITFDKERNFLFINELITKINFNIIMLLANLIFLKQ